MLLVNASLGSFHDEQRAGWLGFAAESTHGPTRSAALAARARRHAANGFL